MSKLVGGDCPAEVSRECRRPNIHTKTCSEVRYHPAEWVPISRWSTFSAPLFGFVPNECSLCALRLPCSEKQNEVKGSSQESHFKSALLTPAKILVEMLLFEVAIFKLRQRESVSPRAVFRHPENSISRQ